MLVIIFISSCIISATALLLGCGKGRLQVEMEEETTYRKGLLYN